MRSCEAQELVTTEQIVLFGAFFRGSSVFHRVDDIISLAIFKMFTEYLQF